MPEHNSNMNPLTYLNCYHRFKSTINKQRFLVIKKEFIHLKYCFFITIFKIILKLKVFKQSAYEKYKNQSEASLYQQPQDIKHALQDGLKANSWLGYAKSFTHYYNYRRLKAYHAGLMSAQKPEDSLNQRIQTIKP